MHVSVLTIKTLVKVDVVHTDTCISIKCLIVVHQENILE